MDDNEEKAKAKNPAEEALDNFSEKVSVAGLKEAFEEHVLWIRHCFKIALVIFCACICFFTYRDIILVAFQRPMTTEITDYVELRKLPMPNVTICVEFCANSTFIRENVTVDDDLAEMIEKRLGLTKMAFLDEFGRYMAIGCRVKEMKSSLIRFIRLVYERNPQMENYGSFVRSYQAKCKTVFKTCTFHGRPFDCCENTQELVSGDGMCFQLGVSGKG